MIFHIRVPFKKFLNIKAKGFTLVELLVTISIVSVISSTIYAPFNTARKKGRDAKRVSEIKSIQTALTLFSDDNGGCYPIDKNLQMILPPQICFLLIHINILVKLYLINLT